MSEDINIAAAIIPINIHLLNCPVVSDTCVVSIKNGVRDLETTGTENYIRNQQDINYLVDQIKEQVQMDTGNLEDLSVSVVINGTFFYQYQLLLLQKP